MKQLIILALAAMPLASLAQGTAQDYKRAYSLQEKFKADNVFHSARNVAWRDSSAVFGYNIQTADGKRWITYDAANATRREYASEEEYNKAMGIKPRQPEKPKFGRQHQRHWMEVNEENSPSPVASPDGKWEAYIEEYNVVLHEVGKPYSQKRILTQDGTIGLYYSNQIQWSPDGQKIFVCKRKPVEKRYVYYVESSPADQLQPLLHKQEYAKPGDELPQHFPCIIDVATGNMVTADRNAISNQYSLDWFRWTPDSKAVTMEYNKRSHKLYQMLAMSAQTGKLTTVVEERSDKFVNYSRLWRHFLGDGTGLLWTSERDNWNHLYMVSLPTENANGKKSKASSSQIRQITKGAWCVRSVQYVDEANKTIYFSASGMNKDEDPYLIHYYKIGFDGKKLTCLTPANGNHSVSYSADHRYLVDTYSRVDCPPVTELRSAADGSLISTLESADIIKLIDNGWQAPEVFTAKGRDGKTDMWGIIQRPTNFDPQKKYPIIEYIYAGPGDAYTPKSFISYNWNTTALAELGFIVVQLDAMGTSWRGKAFEEMCYKNLKDAGFPDRELWIKAAAEKYPYMDSTRVGIFGASAGGQESTTAVLLHGDFYKAAYSSCGCHDNRMDKIWWNEQWMGWPVDSSYVECSNVYNAPKLKRPLMLVVGELDDNVDPASTMQVANALIKANKDFELVVLPGVHHTMGERYGEHKRFDFFVKNLLGVMPPKWEE